MTALTIGFCTAMALYGWRAYEFALMLDERSASTLFSLPAVAIPLSVFAGIYLGYTTAADCVGVAAIDPAHFGVVLIVNMEIAFLTPPIGPALFVLSSIARGPMSKAVRGIWPFVLLMATFLIPIIYVSQASLWPPEMAGMVRLMLIGGHVVPRSVRCSAACCGATPPRCAT